LQLPNPVRVGLGGNDSAGRPLLRPRDPPDARTPATHRRGTHVGGGQGLIAPLIHPLSRWTDPPWALGLRTAHVAERIPTRLICHNRTENPCRVRIIMTSPNGPTGTLSTT